MKVIFIAVWIEQDFRQISTMTNLGRENKQNLFNKLI